MQGSKKRDMKMRHNFARQENMSKENATQYCKNAWNENLRQEPSWKSGTSCYGKPKIRQCYQCRILKTSSSNSTIKTQEYWKDIERCSYADYLQFWTQSSVVKYSMQNYANINMKSHQYKIRICILLQRGLIACNAERCNSYGNSVCQSVCHTLTNEDRIVRSSLWNSKNTSVSDNNG